MDLNARIGTDMRGIFASFVILVGLGCTGDGTVHQVHLGKLNADDDRLSGVDGSYYDDYRFRTKAGYHIEVTLKSADFDPYVHLFDANRSQLAYNDDAKPNGRTARIDFTAPYDGIYYVLANSRDAEEMGSYRLEIRVRPTPSRP